MGYPAQPQNSIACVPFERTRIDVVLLRRMMSDEAMAGRRLGADKVTRRNPYDVIMTPYNAKLP
jgi:hypothetical protein